MSESVHQRGHIGLAKMSANPNLAAEDLHKTPGEQRGIDPS